MQTYIAILRGINVSGNRMIKMDTLRQMFSDMGFTGVKSYIQSGNIIFQSKNGNDTKFEQKITEEILFRFGFDVPVIVLSRDELRIIIEQNPYLSDKSKESNHLHVTFLTEKPLQSLVDKLNADKSLTDDFKTRGRVVYLYCPNGYSKTKISNSLIENRLKVIATTRNWKTCNELFSLATDELK
ncbi:DUF1697 domain-containing protein [Parabacteroides sp. FAFU027]|uniref:DUF1697 domain-containing protein n=1 Tax=Parabacteroides sp. FAFU027 TaxID=2922715 RepID=UPI001FAED8C1|nr:DUF1697 domain-containing protein [Parabacteroides sp. FAFU027]